MLNGVLPEYKIAITGFYGRGNPGDDLILCNLLRFINDNVPDHVKKKITVITSGPTNVVSKSFYGYFKCTQIIIDNIMLFTKWDIRSFLMVIRAHWLIIGGGGIIPGSFRSLIYYCLLAFLGRISGTRVSVIGIGVGEINKVFCSTILIKILLKLADDIVVRDVESQRKLIKLTYKPVICGTDLAYLYPLSSIEKEKMPSDIQKIRIGIFLNGKVGIDTKTWRKVLLECQKIYKSIEVLLIATLIFEGDLIKAKTIHDEIPAGLNSSIKITNDIYEWYLCISSCSVIISERLHPLIVANCLGKQGFAIGVSTKLSVAAQEMGFECAVNAKDFEKRVLCFLNSIMDSKGMKNLVRSLNLPEARLIIIQNILTNTISEGIKIMNNKIFNQRT